MIFTYPRVKITSPIFIGAGVAPHMQRAGCVAIGGVKVAERSTIKTDIGEFREEKISPYLSYHIYIYPKKSLTSCKK